MRAIIAFVIVIMQQLLLIAFGLLAYDQERFLWAVVIWSLCIPMVYLNKWTIKLVMKYGIINFFTMNADTSELDVPQGARWYDDKKGQSEKS